MADGPSFDKYIDNPSGDGVAVITNRQMYKQLYKSKFDKILLREQGKIQFTVFSARDGKDSYYFYMKIPSEVVANFYYDVVVRLYTSDPIKKSSASLREYSVQFYSNDPAFVYTFAYTFNKRGMFIQDLASKMSREALTKQAKTTNPNNQVWYVKSLYFAYLTMEKYNLFSRAMANQHAVKYSKNSLLQHITQANIVIQRRQHLATQKRDNGTKVDGKANDKQYIKQAKSTNIAKTTKVSKVTKVSKITPKSKSKKK